MKISQDIEIRTIDGRKFDMLAGETVEMVMGGFSLLDLSLRSASYTTAFKLPRTSTNESILEFASETTRYNRPKIDIYFRAGTTDKLGVLKVISFDKYYSVSISFTDFKDAMAGHTLNDIVGDIVNPVFTNSDSSTIFNSLYTSAKYTLFHSYSADTRILLKDMGVYINQAEIINMICVKAGYTSVLAAGIDLSTKFLFCRDWYYEVDNNGDNTHFTINIKKTTDIQYKSISVLLKQLCMANGLYFTVDELTKTVTFQKMETFLTSTPVNVETLTLKEKQMYTGHGSNNTIKYSVGEGITTTTKYATFTADGATSKEALQLEILIPSKVGGVHNLADVTELVVASREGTKTSVWYYYEGGGGVYFNTEYLTMPDLAPSYAFMQNVFKDTFVISAEGYIGSLQIESIMSGRVIRSVALGGTYFVETLNYNINTGKSVMTLIKL